MESTINANSLWMASFVISIVDFIIIKKVAFFSAAAMMRGASLEPDWARPVGRGKAGVAP